MAAVSGSSSKGTSQDRPKIEATGAPVHFEAHSCLGGRQLNSLGDGGPLIPVVVAGRPSPAAVSHRRVVIGLVDRLPAADEVAEVSATNSTWRAQ